MPKLVASFGRLNEQWIRCWCVTRNGWCSIQYTKCLLKCLTFSFCSCLFPHLARIAESRNVSCPNRRNYAWKLQSLPESHNVKKLKYFQLSIKFAVLRRRWKRNSPENLPWPATGIPRKKLSNRPIPVKVHVFLSFYVHVLLRFFNGSKVKQLFLIYIATILAQQKKQNITWFFWRGFYLVLGRPSLLKWTVKLIQKLSWMRRDLQILYFQFACARLRNYCWLSFILSPIYEVYKSRLRWTFD